MDNSLPRLQVTLTRQPPSLMPPNARDQFHNLLLKAKTDVLNRARVLCHKGTSARDMETRNNTSCRDLVHSNNGMVLQISPVNLKVYEYLDGMAGSNLSEPYPSPDSSGYGESERGLTVLARNENETSPVPTPPSPPPENDSGEKPRRFVEKFPGKRKIEQIIIDDEDDVPLAILGCKSPRSYPALSKGLLTPAVHLTNFLKEGNGLRRSRYESTSSDIPTTWSTSVASIQLDDDDDDERSVEQHSVRRSPRLLPLSSLNERTKACRVSDSVANIDDDDIPLALLASRLPGRRSSSLLTSDDMQDEDDDVPLDLLGSRLPPIESSSLTASDGSQDDEDDVPLALLDSRVPRLHPSSLTASDGRQDDEDDVPLTLRSRVRRGESSSLTASVDRQDEDDVPRALLGSRVPRLESSSLRTSVGRQDEDDIPLALLSCTSPQRTAYSVSSSSSLANTRAFTSRASQGVGEFEDEDDVPLALLPSRPSVSCMNKSQGKDDSGSSSLSERVLDKGLLVTCKSLPVAPSSLGKKTQSVDEFVKSYNLLGKPLNLVSSKDKNDGLSRVRGNVEKLVRSYNLLGRPGSSMGESTRMSFTVSEARPAQSAQVSGKDINTRLQSPPLLKQIAIPCERLPTENLNIISVPDSYVSGLQKGRSPALKGKKTTTGKRKARLPEGPKPKRRKVAKTKKEKGEQKAKSKKRKCPIPEHYMNYKPCQLRTITTNKMRYKVAFTLWPEKYSGALDRINQRLTNQNAFWNGLR